MQSADKTYAPIRLALPSIELEDAFRTMLAEYQSAGDWEHHQRLHNASSTEFADYVQALRYQAHGRSLRQGFVPNTMYWLMVGDSLVGETNVRHFLTTTLLREGGHIGYRITPRWRRHGYGTQILTLALAQIRQMGIPRILVTCDTVNVGSARIIQKNGGRFENELKSFHTGNQVSRYWFAFTENAGETFPRLEENSLVSPKPRGEIFVFISQNEKLLVLEDTVGNQRLPTSPILSHETAANAAWRTAFQQAGLGHLRQHQLKTKRPDEQPDFTQVAHLDVISSIYMPRYHGIGKKRSRLRWCHPDEVVQLPARQWRIWRRYGQMLNHHSGD